MHAPGGAIGCRGRPPRPSPPYSRPSAGALSRRSPLSASPAGVAEGHPLHQDRSDTVAGRVPGSSGGRARDERRRGRSRERAAPGRRSGRTVLLAEEAGAADQPVELRRHDDVPAQAGGRDRPARARCRAASGQRAVGEGRDEQILAPGRASRRRGPPSGRSTRSCGSPADRSVRASSAGRRRRRDARWVGARGSDQRAGLIVRIDVTRGRGRRDARSPTPRRGSPALEGTEQADDGHRIRKRRTDEVLVAQATADDIRHRRSFSSPLPTAPVAWHPLSPDLGDRRRQRMTSPSNSATSTPTSLVANGSSAGCRARGRGSPASQARDRGRGEPRADDAHREQPDEVDPAEVG